MTVIERLKELWDEQRAKGLCLTCGGNKQVRQVRPLPIRMIECPICHGDGQYRESDSAEA